jgi:hypothetical protein
MKKILFLLTFSLIACRHSREVTKSKTDSTHVAVKTENISTSKSTADEVAAILKGTTGRITITTSKTNTETTEDPVFYPSDNHVFSGAWKFDKDSVKVGKFTLIDSLDTSRRLTPVVENGIFAVKYYDGKKTPKVIPADKMFTGFPTRKTTNTQNETTTYSSENIDTSKYLQSTSSQTFDSLAAIKDTTSDNLHKEDKHTTNNTDVSGWRAFIPLFVGLGIFVGIVALVIFLYKKFKK